MRPEWSERRLLEALSALGHPPKETFITAVAEAAVRRRLEGFDYAAKPAAPVAHAHAHAQGQRHPHSAPKSGGKPGGKPGEAAS